MSKIYKRHSGKLKAKAALDALKEQNTLAELGQKYSVAAGQISAWKKHLEERAEELFEGQQETNYKKEIERLHAVIGKITAERDFLDRVLKH